MKRLGSEGRVSRLKTVLRMVRKCETAAKLVLRSLNDPPDCNVTRALDMYNCHQVLELITNFRSSIRRGRLSSAAFFAFKIGEAAPRFAMRPMADDAARFQKIIAGSKMGAATTQRVHSTHRSIAKSLASELLALRGKNPHLSQSAMFTIIAKRHHISPTTVRRCLIRFPAALESWPRQGPE
jgi:hypothetical protein